jgi:hypothetical protein
MDSHLDRSRRTSINRHSSCCRCRWRLITKHFCSRPVNVSQWCKQLSCRSSD